MNRIAREELEAAGGLGRGAGLEWAGAGSGSAAASRAGARAGALEGAVSTPTLARVLVVEDPRQTEGRLAATLAAAGFAVRTSADGLLGLQAFIQSLPDLIVASDRIEGLEVDELIRRVRELSDLPVVLVARRDGAVERRALTRLRVDRLVVEGRAADELVPTVVALLPSTRASAPRPRVTAAGVRHVARSALRDELERLLVECRGNLAEIGRRMGKDRSTIRYHLRRFGMLVEEGARGASEGRLDGLPGSALRS